MLALYTGAAQAFWIEKRKDFVQPRHPSVHCSGPWHCKPVPGRVVFFMQKVCQDGGEFTPRKCVVRGFWRVRGMTGRLNEWQVYPSKDGQPWACMNSGDAEVTFTGGELGCLFLPKQAR